MFRGAVDDIVLDWIGVSGSLMRMLDMAMNEVDDAYDFAFSFHCLDWGNIIENLRPRYRMYNP